MCLSTDTSASTTTSRRKSTPTSQKVLESGQYVMGPMLKQFEDELAAYHGTKYAIGVGNGTDAIWLALMALGIGPGDEVITHPNTFFATAEAIWIAGATAVFVDCDPKTKCIDPAKIEAAITPKTKAIIPVHLYGQCADMTAIKQDRRQAQALGHRRQRPGHRRARATASRSASSATPPTTSFIIQKNLGTFGDGGALVTNNADIDATVRKLRNHGSTSAQRPQLRLQQPPGRPPRRRPQRQAQAHRRVERPAPQVGRPLHRRPARAPRTSPCPYETARLPPRLPPLRHRDEEAGAARPVAGLPGQERHRRQDAITPIAIHKQAGYPWGKGARIVGSRRQRRAQRRLLRLPADVPRTDRRGSGLRRSPRSLRMGQAQATSEDA